jgi:hypothetical protein
MRISIYRDNIQCICLGQWDLSADYFEDEMLSGMIPVLFAENPSSLQFIIYPGFFLPLLPLSPFLL